MKTHYDILGVDNSASVTEIKRAYRQLAKRYHPDMNPNNANAQELFLQVQAAYEILSDTNKRYAYDKQLSGDYFHTSSPAFDHYFVVSASKTHVKLNDEVFITFTYSGEGRIFRQPDFRGFHVIGKPFIHHGTSVRNGMTMKETSLTFTLAPIQKGLLQIKPAAIKIFNKQFSTSPIGLFIDDNVCHFSSNKKADGTPLIVPLIFEENAQGHLFTNAVYHRHDVLIPRSKSATHFHWLGKLVKIITAAWIVMLGLKYGYNFWPSLLVGLCMGGVNTQLMYKLAGIKSQFRQVRKFPLLQYYFSKGYYPRTILFAERDYNHVIYFVTSLIF